MLLEERHKLPETFRPIFTTWVVFDVSLAKIECCFIKVFLVQSLFKKFKHITFVLLFLLSVIRLSMAGK
ncbi:hypothetical protein [Pseudomonas sp. 25 R 14]|nr:hypothetical protein [Pseudomonas sp. 25 R 14]